jgi:type III secretion protein D
MRNKPPSEIVIIAGEQVGARAALQDNYSVTLSGNNDTDVVLRDARIDNERLKITTKNDKTFIESLAGTFELDGKIVEQGKKLRLNEYEKVKVGGTVFVYTRETSAPWQEILNRVKLNANKKTDKPFLQIVSQYRSNVIYSLTVLIIMLIVAMSTVMTLPDSSDHINMSSTDNINSLLIENGFETLQVNKMASGIFSISGFIMSFKERAQLEQLIDNNNLQAILDLKVGDQLAIEVRELYRVNGIEVQASAIQPGNVKIIGYAVRAEELERIRDVALDQIADIKNIVIDYAEPTNDEKNIGSEMIYNDADKRITMVIDGDPAFIMTSDQSKYYIGALLPTGYKIVDIIDQQVIIEKKGKQKILTF